MNLREASLLLIIGLIYTFIYKFFYTLFPDLNPISTIGIILSILWFLATFTIILFAFYFLREIQNLSKQVKNYLKIIIFLTILLLIGKIIFDIIPGIITINKFVFDIIRLLNTLAILLFLISFNKILLNDIPIKKAAQLAIWGYILSFLLGLISISFYTIYFITNRDIFVFPFITLTAAIVFIYTIIAAVNFLIKLRNIEDYSTAII